MSGTSSPHEPDAADGVHHEPVDAEARGTSDGTQHEPVDAEARGTDEGAQPEPSGLAWAITTRLNRFTRKFLGPAQVGERAPDTQVPDRLPSTPCAVCGLPLSEHELVRTTDAKMRLYCPGTPR
jgi:hypothetical protein